MMKAILRPIIILISILTILNISSINNICYAKEKKGNLDTPDQSFKAAEDWVSKR